jgi:hypothetical protein
MAQREPGPELTLGRTAFGGDPEAYHAARPDYPARVFELVAECCDPEARGRCGGTSTWIRARPTRSAMRDVAPERAEGVLDQIAEIAESRFGGAVERACTTVLYTARMPG